MPADRPETTPQWPRHAASLHITHNQHLAYYETVETALLQGTYRADDFVDEAERQAAIITGEVWEVQWYPDTPIGSYTVLAATFERAVERARRVQEEVDRDSRP